MFAGHIGAGLALGRAAREVNAGVFVAAALLLDVLLWAFILLGWESVSIPADFLVTRQPVFIFPWSHGLLASVGWSLLAGAIAFLALRARRPQRARVAVLVCAAVFSHWLLDALVHRPELPLAGAASARIGLGLWNELPVALAVESVLALGGLWAFLAGSAWTGRRAIAPALLVIATCAFTVLGMTLAPAPPSPAAMAAGSLATLGVVCACAAWLGRSRGAA